MDFLSLEQKSGLKTEIKKQPKALAVQDNALIESCYAMTLNEKRLLLLGISKVNHRMGKSEAAEFLKMNESNYVPRSFTVTSKEWAEFYPQDFGFRALRNAAKGLRSRFATLYPSEDRAKEINWFDSIEYSTKESEAATVKLNFGYSAYKLLTPLLQQFTTVDLLAVNKMNSVYAIRLYEICAQFRTTGVRVISVDDFRLAMGVGEKYPTTKRLIFWVLNKALKEVNLSSDLRVSCKNVKSGKTIKKFKFTITEVKRNPEGDAHLQQNLIE